MHALDSPGGKDAAREIAGALLRRLGEERYQWWFSQGLRIAATADAVTVSTDTQFQLDRVRKRLLSQLREAAGEVYGHPVTVRLRTTDTSGAAVESGPTATPQQDEQSIASVLALKDRQNSSSDAAADDGPSRDDAAPQGGVRRGKRSPTGQGSSRAAEPRASANRKKGNRPVRDRRRSQPALAVRRPEDEPNSADVDAAAAQRRAVHASLKSFVAGDCNSLARAAVESICKKPFNISPIYLWGPPGTGKTHLLAAIRNALRNRHRMRRVIFLTAEQFTNDFTAAVRGGSLPAFRHRYRDVDALLIDDVQFVGGRSATLRELLYTVESLSRRGCQLAFTADRPPTGLKDVIQELALRLAGGMVTQLHALDRETRLSVLKQFAGQHDEAHFQPRVLARLADELAGDGRVLSGAINHLRVLGGLLQRPAEWEELVESAPELIGAGKPLVNLQDIQKAVCSIFNLPSGALRSRGQERTVSQPRMLAMYLARRYTRAPYSQIGEYFGKRSHSTVIASTKKVETMLSEGKPLHRDGRTISARQMLDTIENLLRTG